jgi:hypothetical protein
MNATAKIVRFGVLPLITAGLVVFAVLATLSMVDVMHRAPCDRSAPVMSVDSTHRMPQPYRNRANARHAVAAASFALAGLALGLALGLRRWITLVIGAGTGVVSALVILIVGSSVWYGICPG